MSAPALARMADVAPTAGLSRHARLRRTVVLGVMLIAVLAGLLAANWAPSAAAGDDRAGVSTVTVVVDEGQSLWSVVSGRSYDRDPRVVIDEVRVLNGMDSSVVHPGQRLELPAR